jgi:hypothetical protein
MELYSGNYTQKHYTEMKYFQPHTNSLTHQPYSRPAPRLYLPEPTTCGAVSGPKGTLLFYFPVYNASVCNFLAIIPVFISDLVNLYLKNVYFY